MANEKKYERSIELLNNALAEENTASLQYMYFHFICEDKGYRPLAQYFKRTAIQEMKHAEEFAERILFLEGEVKMVLAKGVKHITEVPEMLDYARELEKGTIEDYNAWSKETAALGDAGGGGGAYGPIPSGDGELEGVRQGVPCAAGGGQPQERGVGRRCGLWKGGRSSGRLFAYRSGHTVSGGR